MVEAWKVLNSEQIIANRWLTVRRDACQTGSGIAVSDYYVVEKPNFAMAVAITAQNELVLVRQYKHGCGGIVLECPAGYLNEGENPDEAVRRELREETGYAADEFISLGAMFASPSVLNTKGHLYLCPGVVRIGEQRPDATEDIEVVLLDFATVARRMLEGDLEMDLASVAAVLMAQQRLGKK